MYPLSSSSSWPLNSDGVGLVPDGHEQPRQRELDSSSLRLSRTRTPITVVSPRTSMTEAFQPEGDLGVGEGPLLHDLGGPQLTPAVDDGDLVGEAGQEEGLFHGRVAPADDGDLLLPEEESVAGGAGGHPVAEEPLLVRAG